MKESYYNYYVPHGDKTIFFNGRTKRFFSVSKQNARKFVEIIKEPERYKIQFGTFITKMKKEGFILEDADNEYQLAMKEYRKQLFQNQYTLMIIPTYQCNLKCWYCYQDHRHDDMSEETVRRIKLHICNYLSTLR